MRQILLPLSKGLMTRSGLEPSFLTMLSTSKVFDVRVLGKSFLNNGLEYGCLSCAAIIELLEPSFQVVLLYA